MAAAPAPTTVAPAGAGDSPPVVFRADGKRVAPHEKITVEPVDFRNSGFLAEGELRRLRTVHQDFAQALNARMTSLLRTELTLNIGRFETRSCGVFIEGLKSPNQISLFRVTPLNGIGFLEIPPALAIAMTNRILGGREPGANPDTYLTEIEIALLEDVIAIITGEWCEQWHDETAMNAHLISHETNPRFIQSTAKDTVMLVVGMDISLGRCEETIQIAVPLSMIEPMMKRLQAAKERETDPQSAVRKAAWRGSYDHIAIPVHAEIVASRMTVAALLALKTGGVIELPASALEAVRINVAGTVRFTARAGQQDGYIAVEIADKV